MATGLRSQQAPDNNCKHPKIGDNARVASSNILSPRQGLGLAVDLA